MPHAGPQGTAHAATGCMAATEGVIPFVAAARGEPRPLGMMRIVVGDPGREHTVITRTWAPGDAARCRRCPTCEAHPSGTFCTLVAEGFVPASEASAFGIRRPSPGAAGVGPEARGHRLARLGVQVLDAGGGAP